MDSKSLILLCYRHKKRRPRTSLDVELVELAGVEPASKISLTNGTTCLVYLCSRPYAASRRATQGYTRIGFNVSTLELKFPRDLVCF